MSDPLVALGRIHAHICADGCVYSFKSKRSKKDLESHPRRNPIRNNYMIEYWNTSEVLLQEFAMDFKEAFNRKCNIRKRGYVRISGAKDIIFLLELEGKNSYNWQIPSYIFNGSKELKINWIRAFFDDEATIEIMKNRIRVKSVNKKGLIQIQRIMNKIYLSSKITGPNCDKTWDLCLYYGDAYKYLRGIGFLHVAKVAKARILEEKLWGEGDFHKRRCLLLF